MKRKDFLRQSFTALGAIAIMPFFSSCSKDDVTTTDTGGTDDDNDSDSCSKYPSVTEGPYPTKNPENFIMSDITSDREGTALTTAITIKDASTCSIAEGVIIDIWHCDALGNYSQYNSYASVDFLRGRQTTSSAGVVNFTSIYPGWYRGRTTHIHLHAYSSSGTSLVVAQIAFPEDVNTTVYNQGVYAPNGQKDTSNASDDIFAASYSSGTVLDISVATITGNTTDGYALTHTIAY